MNSGLLGVVPMRDKIIVTEQVDGGLDDWGRPIYSAEEKTFPCTIFQNLNEESVVIGEGKTKVFSAKIYSRLLVPVEQDAKIKLYDMYGKIVEKTVIKVSPIRDFGGRILATTIYV